jgi:TonB-dependent SusC/RagA subfamily outer membrane receptor
MITKNAFIQIAIALIVLVSGIPFGCTSSGASSTTKQRPERAYTSLIDMLREQPQLSITGSGSNATIRIRGNKSLLGDNEPLFVVDGTPVGTYNSISSSIDVNSVESIRILSGAQTSIYGARGANGVVLIKMK